MEVNNNEKNIKFGWKIWLINNNRCSSNNIILLSDKTTPKNKSN